MRTLENLKTKIVSKVAQRGRRHTARWFKRRKGFLFGLALVFGTMQIKFLCE